MIHTLIGYIHKLIFEKNKEPIWKQFANEIDGEFKKDIDFHVAKNYKDYKILIESYIHYTSVGGNNFEKTYLKGQIEFQNENKLSLLITPKDAMINLKKLFGTNDFASGFEKFDKRFIIQGNEEYKIQNLLSDDKLRDLILELNPIQLSISDEKGLFNELPLEKKSMIYFISDLKLKNTNQLHQVYQMLTIMIEALSKNETIKRKSIQ